MQKKLIYFFTIVATVTIAFLINSCQQTPISPTVNKFDGAGNDCYEPNIFCDTGTIQTQNACPGDVQTIILWAGNPPGSVNVGYVEFEPVSGNTWKVTYHFTDPDFEAESIHFAIECNLADIPQTRQHNPKPGQFEYSFNGPFGSSYDFNITLPDGCTCFYVAAHAGGTLGGLQCFNSSIPAGCVTVSNVGHDPNGNCYAYFELSNAGTFSGNWCGWCMDCNTSLGTGTYTCANIYSSLDPFPEGLKGLIEGWQNLDKVNYLLNHFHVGDTVQPLDGCFPVGGPEILTFMDIQASIWTLLDLGTCLGGLRPELTALTTAERRNAILCDVNTNGEGFVPSCANGDKVAFFIDPDPINHSVQPVLAMAPCCDAQGVTAWGDGLYGAQFGGNSWATYFKWCPTCP